MKRPLTAAAHLAALLRNSPDVGIADISGLNVGQADVTLEANAGAVGVDVPNPLAAKFEYLWRTWGGPELVKEYRFHPHRRWRADYALIDAKVLIELEGGLYGNGRHNRAAGYLADIEKYNAASMLGYVVLRLGTGQVDHQHVTEIIDWIKGRVTA